MSEEDRTYFIGLKVELQFEGKEIPCEETILSPIKKFVKDHIKLYKNTTRVLAVDSTIREVEDEEEIEEDEF